MIVSVACRLIAPVDLGAVKAGDELILSMPRPCRHHHILHMIVALGLKDSFRVQPEDQGFLTDDGQFLNRIDGAAYAIEKGQIEKLQWGYQLYSEDLW